MAAPRGFHPQTVFCNKFSIMVSDIVRFAFIDERENIGRSVETTSVVGEFVMTKEKAVELAHYILETVKLAQPKEEMEEPDKHEKEF